MALTNHTWINEFGHSLGGPSGDSPADLHAGRLPCLFSGTITASEWETSIMSDHFQHLTQENLGPWGKWFLHLRFNTNFSAKNNNKIYSKPCLGARMFQPSTAAILEQVCVYSRWGKGMQKPETKVRNIPSSAQYIPAATLLHTLWQPKLSPDFTKCTREHEFVPGWKLLTILTQASSMLSDAIITGNQDTSSRAQWDHGTPKHSMTSPPGIYQSRR